MERTQWEVAASETDEPPEDGWIEAKIPGAVQLDWAVARGWKSWYEGGNFRDYEGLEKRHWFYRVALPDAVSRGRRMLFRCGGIDYRYEIRVDEAVLLSQEGTQQPVEVDVTDGIGSGNWLYVHIFPAPENDAGGKLGAVNSAKAVVNYGWDFCPRLIPLGIWDRAAFFEVPIRWLSRAETTYRLRSDCGLARLALDVAIGGDPGKPGKLSWTLYDPGGNTVFTRAKTIDGPSARLEADVVEPELWWPHNHGGQPLYASVVEWQSGGDGKPERREKRIGFRRVRLVKHEGGWADEPPPFPAESEPPQTTIEINGRRILGKGSNWVPPSVFPGAVTGEDYARLLDLAKGANMNLLRLWGGANAPHDTFYEKCDELGLMVWQEFPLACADYEDQPEYLAVLDADSRAQIRRLREHPSVILWCGGNELFNSWSRMDMQAHALRLLNRNCYDLDPDTPFFATSPMQGMGHGPYCLFDTNTGLETWEAFQSSALTTYTEFGMPGIASVETLRLFLPEEKLWPVDGVEWYWHKAFGQWVVRDAWLFPEHIERAFGESRSIDELVERSQLLQAEIFKGIFEEARRQQPRVGMITNWCFNEPWPTAANNSLVSWPATPKPALAAVGEALRPILCSARIPRFLWKVGETFEAEVWRLNDSQQPLPASTLTATLVIGGDRYALGSFEFAEAVPARNQRGGTVRLTLPESTERRMRLEIACDQHPEWNATYTLSLEG